jgi:hypothetical protein
MKIEMPKSHTNAFDGVCCYSPKVIAIELKAYHLNNSQ